MISADNLSRKFLVFLCEPGRARFTYGIYQFQQRNSLLIRKKIILKNEQFDFVEGVNVAMRAHAFKYHTDVIGAVLF